MTHLTDDQLSALLDDALPAPGRAACESHLAACAACRARLAEASAADASLRGALEHDPGEAYFESFADRVAARIAATPAGTARREPGGRPPFWRWLLSPSGLALVGSSAALVAVAGIAWVQFHDRDDAGRALQEAVREAPPTAGTAPTESPGSAVPDGRGAPLAADDAAGTAPGTAPLAAGEARARRVERLASGEEVPVTDRARTANEAAEPSGGSPLAQAKRRALAPATGAQAPVGAASGLAAAPPPSEEGRAGAPAEAPARAERESARSPVASAEGTTPPAGTLPAPVAKSLTGADRSAPAARQEVQGAPSLAIAPETSGAPAGGTVLDSRGAPVAGARVTVVNDLARSSKSGPDGRFTLPRLAVGDTLSVLRVGFEPARVVVTGNGPVAVRLEPVGPLAPQSPERRGENPPPAFGGPSARGFVSPPTAKLPAATLAPSPDVYAGASGDVREAVERARTLLATAKRDRSAAGLDEAVLQWERVAASVTGAAEWDARFQALSARREALSLAPGEARLAFFRARLTAFLASAPDSLPERATAQRWQAELSGGTRSLYR